jgi:hypothetical protein
LICVKASAFLVFYMYGLNINTRPGANGGPWVASDLHKPRAVVNGTLSVGTQSRLRLAGLLKVLDARDRSRCRGALFVRATYVEEEKIT